MFFSNFWLYSVHAAFLCHHVGLQKRVELHCGIRSQLSVLDASVVVVLHQVLECTVRLVLVPNR